MKFEIRALLLPLLPDLVSRKTLVSFLDSSTITYEQACERRLRLMKEREGVAPTQN